MSTLETQPVGKIVARHPQLAKIFEKRAIDYCCRGGNTLRDACDACDVDLNEILEEIESALQADENQAERDWSGVGLSELIDHIVSTHHQFLRTELPRITELIQKVRSAHGAKHPELTQIEQVFAAMRDELESHMMKEENVLFPAICTMEQTDSTFSFPFGSVNNPIQQMEHEHDDAGESLRSLQQLTNGYTPPPGACPTFCVMMQSLEHLQFDLHQHIHKENNILFPRAQQLEQGVATTQN